VGNSYAEALEAGINLLSSRCKNATGSPDEAKAGVLP
jgi:hypothetical protein